jgi:hypothetical protein
VTDQEFHHTISESERPRRLLAASIRAIVGARLGIVVDQGAAEALARAHTLGTALKTIRAKLALHQDIPKHARHALAIQESCIDGPFGQSGMHRITSIVDIRRTTLGTSMDADAERERSAAFQRKLWQIQKDVSDWAKLLKRFLNGFEKLHQSRVHDLELLRLAEPTGVVAKQELDRLFADALDEFCVSLNGERSLR